MSLAEFNPLSVAGIDGIRPVMLHHQLGRHQHSLKASYLTNTLACWKNATGIFFPKPGKGDYYNPKSYRTISLAPVDGDTISIAHRRGSEDKLQTQKEPTWLHQGCINKLVHKIERFILNSGMALGTLLDIEGAFDYAVVHAIENALNKKCFSPNTNNWIMSTLKSRGAIVEIHVNTKTIIVARGCPQG